MYRDHLKRSLATTLLIYLVIVPTVLANSLSLPIVPPATVSAITATELRKHLSFLAAPELGGRYTFSSGNRIAARYLASELESFGYRGAARDGSFLQKIKFVSRSFDTKNSYLQISPKPEVSAAVARSFAYGRDFSTGTPMPIDLKAELVFVGYGSSAQNGSDDYQGLDVKGKVVLAIAPVSADWQAQGVHRNRVQSLAEQHGAVGVFYISADDPLKNAQASSPEDSTFDPEDNLDLAAAAEQGTGPAVVPLIDISHQLGQSLLATGKLNLDKLFKWQADHQGEAYAAQLLPVTVSVELTNNADQFEAYNVVGLLEGSDPKLKKEYLMISAHYDHLKTEGQQVYCGADDDGSGTAAVLTIAHALARGERPKRSIIVVFHTGEELGLYGSRYFTEVEPLVPLTAIVADLNIDMIGRSRPTGKIQPQDRELTDKDSLYLIGSDKHSTQLHRLSEQTNRELFNLHFNYTYNDENHPLRLYYRSDHYNYASKGIPVIFYFTGLHADYHRASDTIDKIDFDKMTRITRLVFATGWRIANLPQRLQVDKWHKG